ncbi:hypothetical protein [Herbaspirillum rhizosphaerae]|uniref:hypothetical protein n=1 Tax=Herbaspirillum rhizosphaerae TaxID=346179 RepID=UPI000A8E4A84|nr:hypothetical protein [Herbaspirillum rhizosphaerae]
MPFTRQPVARPRHRRSRALPIPSLIGASLLPLLGLTNAVQAQTLPGISAANIATMDLETTLQQVQQQRTQVQKQQSSDGTAANLAYASKLSAALTVLRQQLQQNPRPTAEQKQQLAQVEQSLTALAKVTQALAQPAKQGQSSSTSQEQQQLLQQIAQSVQSMLAQSGNPAGSPVNSPESTKTQTKTQTESKNEPETKTSPGSKMTTAPESQSQEIARPGVEKSPGKSPAKPATTSEVMMHLAAGQGDGAAQAQAAIPAASTASTGAARTADAAPEGGAPQSPAGGATPGNGSGSSTPASSEPTSATAAGASGVTTVGIAGVSTGAVAAGALAIAVAAAAAVSSGDGTSTTTQSALQQQQQQQASTAATAAQQQAFNYVTAGLVTPLASIPSSLSATYTGPVNGTLNSGASIGGTLSASVNFATIRSGAPSIAGGITFNGNQGSTSFNLTLLGGYVGGSMSGTYAGQNVTGFIMNGQFFGPAAEQLAGAWSMQNTGGSLSATGTFKAKQ